MGIPLLHLLLAALRLGGDPWLYTATKTWLAQSQQYPSRAAVHHTHGWLCALPRHPLALPPARCWLSPPNPPQMLYRLREDFLQRLVRHASANSVTCLCLAQHLHHVLRSTARAFRKSVFVEERRDTSLFVPIPYEGQSSWRTKTASVNDPGSSYQRTKNLSS